MKPDRRADRQFHHVLKEIHGSAPTDPIARLTHLGWVCFGPTQLENHHRRSHSHFTCTYRTSQVEMSPDEQLRQFWELEALGIRDNNDQILDEKEAVAKVSNTVVLHLVKGSTVCFGNSVEKRRATPEEQLRHGIKETRKSREGA